MSVLNMPLKLLQKKLRQPWEIQMKPVIGWPGPEKNVLELEPGRRTERLKKLHLSHLTMTKTVKIHNILILWKRLPESRSSRGGSCVTHLLFPFIFIFFNDNFCVYICSHEPVAGVNDMVRKLEVKKSIVGVMTSLTKINRDQNWGRSWCSSMDIIFVPQIAPLHCIVVSMRKELRHMKLFSFVFSSFIW